MDLKKILTEENVGGLDLWIRALLGSTAIVALALFKIPYPWDLIVGLIALGGLFTSITRHCTPYALIGYNTGKKK